MNKLKSIFTYGILSIAAIVSLFPFAWMLISMTNKSSDISQGRLLPGSNLLENLRNLFESYNVGSALFNSFFIAIVATVLCLVVSSLAGYGFEIYRSKGKDIVFNILLLSMMIPFAALMVPLFRLFGDVSQVFPAFGIDTLYAVILPYVSTAFFIFFFRQNTKMFTKDLIEAGRIDGLSEIGIFFRIYMPSMKNTFAAAGIISFMNNWNNFLWPLVILQSPDVQTIPLLISNLGSGYSPDFGIIYTAIVIGTIPTALIFFFLQKYFVEGMTGSVKG
ncbi:carbohydrate ABC transporter permease [Oceanobacillus halophilus]|uniref:Carbohydrate ABC transporter permease n=1 Tax=Oceanobacillus halophilus TaxID=930130 RepID=A0A494ZUY8_9BACI|nr:carbohydrate ABC transporter permease [Oceanobacillus halophilus]RKQ30226.1 carbohydrate ABC transporter permease [Oceanobacillus halophilus]